MPECLGINLGAKAVSLAVVNRSKAGLSIRAFRRLEYPPDVQTAAARAAFAAKAASESEWSRLPVALSLSGTDIFLRPLTVPFTKRSHIARTLKFELEGLLLFDVETAIIDFASLSSAQGSTKLLVAALPEATLAELAAPLEDAGLRLQLVTADVLSVEGLAAVLGEKDFAFLNVGPGGWKLSICCDDSLLFARAAPASPAEQDVEVFLGGWYRQSVMAAPTGTAPAKVFLTGEDAGALDTAKLSEAIGVPVERVRFAVDPAAPDALQLEEAAKLGVAAVSVAAEGCRGGGAFDFYAGASGRQGLVERLFLPAVTGFAALTALFAVLAWHGFIQADPAQRDADLLKKAEVGIWTDLFKAQKPADGDISRSLASAVSELEQGALKETKGGKAAPLLRALAAVAKSVPPGEKLRFKTFDARDGRVQITVLAAQLKTFETFLDNLNKDSEFRAEQRSSGAEGGQRLYVIDMTPQ